MMTDEWYNDVEKINSDNRDVIMCIQYYIDNNVK